MTLNGFNGEREARFIHVDPGLTLPHRLTVQATRLARAVFEVAPKIPLH